MEAARLVVVTFVACGALALERPAVAASNPSTLQIFVKCGVLTQDPFANPQPQTPQCNQLGGGRDGWFEGRFNWYSGNQLLWSETGPFFIVTDPGHGFLQLFLDGNGSATTFEAIYDNPATSILTAPNLNWALYAFQSDEKNPPQLVAAQPYLPEASALWAKHSEDGALAVSGVTTETQRALAAEAHLQTSLAAETSARIASNGALASAVSLETARALAAELAITSSVSAEMARALAAEAILGSALTTEIARASGAETQLDNALASEVAARAAAFATLQAEVNAEAAARTAADAATLATAKAYVDARSPWQTSCPVNQLNVSTGNGGWKCASICGGAISDTTMDPANCGGCGIVCLPNQSCEGGICF